MVHRRPHIAITLFFLFLFAVALAGHSESGKPPVLRQTSSKPLCYIAVSDSVKLHGFTVWDQPNCGHIRYASLHSDAEVVRFVEGIRKLNCAGYDALPVYRKRGHIDGYAVTLAPSKECKVAVMGFLPLPFPANLPSGRNLQAYAG